MMRLNFLLDYVKHRFNANTRHGTHSPFVYALADEIIYAKKSNEVYEKVENQRRKCSSSSLRARRLGQLLYRIAKQRQPINIIEVSTGLGITTAYLSLSNPKSKIVTVSSNEEAALDAKQNLKDLKIDNVEIRAGKLEELFKKAITEGADVDLVCINQLCSSGSIYDYFESFLPKARENSLFIVRDIYSDKAMKTNWERIKNHSEVTVTVDLFWLGLVYFKKGQAKEHFKLKF